MRLSTIIANSTLLLAFLIPSVAMANECAQIDCDCSAIGDQKWRAVCENREGTVRKECVENGGTPNSYCSLHGPQGFPVAVSLRTDQSSESFSDNAEALEKQINTQRWSLQDSLNVVKAKEADGHYGDAIQLSSLFERDADRLYRLVKQQLTNLNARDQVNAARSSADDYGRTMTDIAGSIDAYSQTLWARSTESSDARAQKAFRVMSLKLARLAANIYEQGADLFGTAGRNKAAAEAWQSAASVAKTLMDREIATENKERHVEFYQAQAAARLHRATFYWLRTNEYHDRVVSNMRVAEEIVNGRSAVESVVELDNLHETDNQSMRAMKRPSQ